MNKRHWPTVIAGGIMVVVLTMAFVLSQSSAGQVPASKTGAVLSQSKGLAAVALPGKDAAPAVQQAMASAPVAPSSGEAAPPGPGVEGLKVSGHWTIEVREPDGRLVSRTEFENALNTVVGTESLARFLARDKSPGLWSVELTGSPYSNTPCLSGTNPLYCFIIESANTDVTGPTWFKTLVVSLTSDSKVRLSGTATAQRDGNVGNVATGVSRCQSSTAPVTPCTTTTGISYQFTYKTLTTPVSVLQNQQVAITVDISFN